MPPWTGTGLGCGRAVRSATAPIPRRRGGRDSLTPGDGVARTREDQEERDKLTSFPSRLCADGSCWLRSGGPGVFAVRVMNRQPRRREGGDSLTPGGGVAKTLVRRMGQDRATPLPLRPRAHRPCRLRSGGRGVFAVRVGNEPPTAKTRRPRTASPKRRSRKDAREPDASSRRRVLSAQEWPPWRLCGECSEQRGDTPSRRCRLHLQGE